MIKLAEMLHIYRNGFKKQFRSELTSISKYSLKRQ